MVDLLNKVKPVVLVILDGWGVAPPSQGNAITLAKIPIFNELTKNYLTLTLRASGEAVGLSFGEIGNSEVGHLSIGSGRVIWQDLPKIFRSINDGIFFTKPAFLKAIEHLKKNKSNLHLIGLVSTGSVHSHIEHLYGLLELAKRNKIKKVYIHAILDGRDSPAQSASYFISELEKKIKEIGLGKIITLSGRFYAMDRDRHWERIEMAYRTIAEGVSKERFSKAQEAINSSYQKKVFDEEFYPIAIGKTVKIKEGDGVIFFNFRSERARELTEAFVLDDFQGFSRQKINNLFFATMTEYEKDLPVEVVFEEEGVIQSTLAEVLSRNNLLQFHIAETEKYAHVTFFFNGSREEPFNGEIRKLIPSPRVPSYALCPEMSALKVTEEVLSAIKSNQYSFILVNFANPDIVGHSGEIEATKKAIESVDKCLGEIILSCFSQKIPLLITADHGNAEELINLRTGEPDKEHSTNPVPFIIVEENFKNKTSLPEAPDLSAFSPVGILADIAPTILHLMGLPQSKEMTGKSLI